MALKQKTIDKVKSMEESRIKSDNLNTENITDEKVEDRRDSIGQVDPN